MTSMLGVVAIVTAAVVRHVQADSKPAKITKEEMTSENLIQLDCINGSVAGGIVAVREKYWPGVGERDPKVKAFNQRTYDILNGDKEFNKRLGLFCFQIQSMAKKLSASQGK